MNKNNVPSQNPFLPKSNPPNSSKSLLSDIISQKCTNQIKKTQSQIIKFGTDSLNQDQAKVNSINPNEFIAIDKTNQQQNQPIVKNQTNNRVMNLNVLSEEVQKNVGKSQNVQLNVIRVVQKLEKYRSYQQVFQKQIFTSFHDQQNIVFKGQQQIQSNLLFAKKKRLLAKSQQINKQIQDSKNQKIKLIIKQKDILKQIQSLQMPKIKQCSNQNRKYILPIVDSDGLLRIQSLSHHLEGLSDFKENRRVIIQNQKQINQRNQSLKSQLSQLQSQLFIMNQINPDNYSSFVAPQQNRHLQQLKMRSKMLQEQYKMLKKNKMANRPKQLGCSKLQMGFSLSAKDEY